MNGVYRFKAPEFSKEQVVGLGAAAVSAIQDRLDKRQNVADQPAKPYSPRGPVYKAIFGKGTFSQQYTTEFGTTAWRITKRTKTALRGAEGFTAKDLRKLRARPGVFLLGDRSTKGRKPGLRDLVIGRTESGKLLKFANYAEYKRALGKSGERDLEVSGRMRGAIAIVKVNKQSIEIGFTREQEHKKALGNQARDAWFGLSPNDRKPVLELAQSYLPGVVKDMPERKG